MVFQSYQAYRHWAIVTILERIRGPEGSVTQEDVGNSLTACLEAPCDE